MWWILWLACPRPEEQGPCAAGEEPTLEVGEGATEYAVLGDEVTLIRGPQGGYHVEVALEATYLAAGGLVAGSVVGRVEGQQRASVTPWIEFRCNGATETLQSFGTQLVFDIDGPEEVHGKTVSIEATVVDEEGTEVFAEGAAVVSYPDLR